MDVLSSRILIRPSDSARSRHFYGEVLGLAVFREFGSPSDPGVVYFIGGGLLEVSGRGNGVSGDTAIWLQVRDVRHEYARIVDAGGNGVREPVAEPWGLVEAWIADPDGQRIVLVETPREHPLRRDARGLE